MPFVKTKTMTGRGFTLIEVMIFSLILVLVTINFYRIFAADAKVLRDAKARIAASQIANEKFEVLRNVAYEDLTTDTEHDPHVTENEVAVRSGISFDVHTGIRYVDDDFDGTAEESTDSRPTDYKQVEVTVSWAAGADTRNVAMTVHMAPPGTEELYNGGILNIEVRQSDGTQVQGAAYDIRNAVTNQSLFSGTTLADGKIYLIGLDEGDKLYKISVSKGGYEESITTLPPYDQTAYDPVDEHASVILAGIWSQTMIIDPLATVDMRTQDPLGNAIGNIDFSLEGGRKLGDTVPGGIAVYSHAPTNHQADSSGMFSLTDENPGRYFFEYSTVSANNTDYDFWKVDPSYGGIHTGFFADPGAVTDVAVLLLPKNTPSLFLKVVDQADGTPISEARVIVRNTGLAYDQEEMTDQFGQVYFPDKDGGGALQDTQYEVTVQAAGYQDAQTNIDVSGLTKQDIQIHP